MEMVALQEFLPAFLVSFAFKLMMAGIGYYFIRLILAHLDKIIDFNFKEWMKTASDTAKAIYLSSRIMGICIYVGWVVS
jgi:hypothetical protein